MIEKETPVEIHHHETKITYDLDGLWAIAWIIVLLYLALGTQSGNRYLCQKGWQPTFIECSKLIPEKTNGQ